MTGENSRKSLPVILLLLATITMLSAVHFTTGSDQPSLNSSRGGLTPYNGLAAPAASVSAATASVPSTLPAWTTASPMPTPREGYGAAEVNGVFYYIAGYGPTGDNTVNEAYSPSNDSWITKASLPSNPRSETVAVTDGTFVYLIGGRPTSIVGRDLWRYSPIDNTWTSLSSMPTARATEHMGVYYNGEIYVVGGRTSSAPSGLGTLDVLEIYNIASDTWTTGTSLPQPLTDGYAVQLNGKIYVFGGFHPDGTASNSTYIYDITSNAWTTGEPAPAGTVDPAAGICGSLIYVIGGSNAFLGLQTSSYVYNPSANTWNTSLSIPTPTAEVEAISYKGQIFVVGGGIFGSGSGNHVNQVFHCADNLLYVSPSTQPVQPSGTTVTYRVKVANIQPFSSWNIMVRSNQTVINPQSVSITGNLFQRNFTASVTELINCVNGQGKGCSSSDGPGIVHSSATVSLNPNATLNGLLFAITYKAGSGPFSPVELFNANLGAQGSCCDVPHNSQNAIYGKPPPDFSLGAFPARILVGRGSTGSSTIIATSLNNFTGTVSLSATVTPQGPILIFNRAKISVVANGTVSSTLTVSTTDALPLGDYNVSVVGMSGLKSHSVQVKITVVPNFSITAQPASATILPGSRVNSTITLTSHGFSGSLSLSVRVAPLVANLPETLLNVSSVILAPSRGVNVSLLVETYFFTQPGNYTITVTASGIISHSVTVSVDVLAPALTASPSSGVLGTKVLVQGSDFPVIPNFPFQDNALVSFDDMFLGTAPITNGSFTFVLDMPHAEPGLHTIKALDLNTLAHASTAFIVLPGSSGPLTVSIQVGAIYFPGDTAVISILTTQPGATVDSSKLQLQVLLIRPDGSNVTLTANSVSAGVFRASYTIPKTGSIGTYAILVKASLSGQNGLGLQTFEVKLSWLSTNSQAIAGVTTIVGVIGIVALAWRKGYFSRKGEDWI